MSVKTIFTKSVLLSATITSYYIVKTTLAFTPLHALQIHRQPSKALSMAEGGLQNQEGDPVSALTSTLARLDKQWKIQQQAKPTSRWSKLVIPLDSDNSSSNNVDIDATNVKEVSSETIIRGNNNEEYVYLLEPPDKTLASSIIVFIGGAGLGTFPQIAYNEFLIQLSNKLNAAIIATPYTINLDHFTLSKQVGELTRRARIHLHDQHNYPSTLPTFLLAHSLGCKLSSIYLAATNQQFDGIGFMSYNNFAFSRTIGMVKIFAQDMQKSFGSDLENSGGSFGGGFGGGGGLPGSFPFGVGGLNSDIMNNVFGFVEMAVSMVGLEFTPNPDDMNRLLQLKYDEERQKKTRLFVFDNDNMDSTEEFVNSCNGEGPKVSALPGSHLVPVFFQFNIRDLPEETRDMAREASGGLESASFGNEKDLNALVDEVSGWMLGKESSRSTDWRKKRVTIAAGINGTEE